MEKVIEKNDKTLAVLDALVAARSETAEAVTQAFPTGEWSHHNGHVYFMQEKKREPLRWNTRLVEKEGDLLLIGTHGDDGDTERLLATIPIGPLFKRWNKMKGRSYGIDRYIEHELDVGDIKVPIKLLWQKDDDRSIHGYQLSYKDQQWDFNLIYHFFPFARPAIPRILRTSEVSVKRDYQNQPHDITLKKLDAASRGLKRDYDAYVEGLVNYKKYEPIAKKARAE
jgi:hypothetical protein